jgi:hypothetical protein
MFCIHFTLQMLRRRGDFATVCADMGDDAAMTALRGELFDAQ